MVRPARIFTRRYKQVPQGEWLFKELKEDEGRGISQKGNESDPFIPTSNYTPIIYGTEKEISLHEEEPNKPSIFVVSFIGPGCEGKSKIVGELVGKVVDTTKPWHSGTTKWSSMVIAYKFAMSPKAPLANRAQKVRMLGAGKYVYYYEECRKYTNDENYDLLFIFG